MTYCLAIRVNEGLVFASDSRTNAGVDYVNTYSKMHIFRGMEDRQLILLSAGNLATTQSVLNSIERDLSRKDSAPNIANLNYLFDIAGYIGELSRGEQRRHASGLEQSTVSLGASFILGGQIKGRPTNLFQIYPEGNYISASDETPYIQIGENKYGKPVLDRFIRPQTPLNDAARCALVSLDSTMRSNISVGPPLELAVYRDEDFKISKHLSLRADDDFLPRFSSAWSDGLHKAFYAMPRFDWEESE